MAKQWFEVGDEPIPGHRLVSRIAGGAYGQVWKTRAPGGLMVALKIMDEFTPTTGGREFRALLSLRGLRHPNLVDVHGIWLKNRQGDLIIEEEQILLANDEQRKATGASRLPERLRSGGEEEQQETYQLFIVMGLGDGSLSSRLKEYRKQRMLGIPLPELLVYMRDAADGIDFLNKRNEIFHCDIKPANILILGGRGQVCDFGLARAVNEQRKSMQGSAMTVAYAPPEVIQAGPSQATDQFSLAITYYELRTGQLPYTDQSSVMSVAQAICRGDFDFSLVSHAEQDVLLKATQIDPDDRFATCRDLVKQLGRAAGEEDSTAPLNVPAARPSEPPPAAKSDDHVVSGYLRKEQLFSNRIEEVWEAKAPGGKTVAMVVRNLRDSGGCDISAIAATINLGHRHLTEPMACWWIDQQGREYLEADDAIKNSGELTQVAICGRRGSGTILERIQKHQAATQEGLPQEELLSVLRQVAAAVDFLNAPRHVVNGATASLIHNRVCPVNFILDESGVRLGNHTWITAATSHRVPCPPFLRTNIPPWAPPEIARGWITRWSDQYSLAIAYLEMRLGVDLRFDDDTTAEVFRTCVNDLIDYLPEVEQNAVLRALATSPEKRFDNCNAFVNALCPEAAEPSSESVFFDDESDDNGESALRVSLPRSTATGLPEPAPLTSPTTDPLSATRENRVVETATPTAYKPAPEQEDHYQQTDKPQADAYQEDVYQEDEDTSPPTKPLPRNVPWGKIEEREDPPRRTPWLRYALVVVLFIALGLGGSFLQSRSLQQQFDAAVQGGQHSQAIDHIDAIPFWCAWRFNQREMQSQVAERWAKQVKALAQSGQIDSAAQLLDQDPRFKRLIGVERYQELQGFITQQASQQE